MTDLRHRPVAAGEPYTNGRPKPRRRNDSRVPPHNLQAEESLLGSALLSGDAGRRAHDLGVRPEHFYKPAHQYIWDNITALMAIDAGHDGVLVANELRAAGLLEEAGGVEYLAQLQNATPAISNVGRYAKIVLDTARMRATISLAGELAEAAYAEPDDVAGALADFDLKLMKLIDDATTADLPFADMAAVLAGDLTPLRPDLLYRIDGNALFYTGRLNVLQGPPASGKTWVAYMLAKAAIDLDQHITVLDYEDTAQTFAIRLLALGVRPEQIVTFVHFLTPPLGTKPEQIIRAMQRNRSELLIIDSVAESMAFYGYSENETHEYLRWLDELPRRASNMGITVVLLDHVVKSRDEQGHWARGTGAKLGATNGSTFSVKTTGFNQTTAGRIILTVAKDRSGGLCAKQGEKIASIFVSPSIGGTVLDTTIEIPLVDPSDPGAADERAAEIEAEVQAELVAKILEVVQRPDAPFTRRDLATKVRSAPNKIKASDSKLDIALSELVDDRAITKTIGGRGTHFYGPKPTQQKLAVDPPQETS